uniref:Aminotransferase-like plant mobile domain-containing protein n=1 Tax=Quercus lobata TaxID=97700 RepID=A0A7N2KTQ1_QUELO
MAAVPAQLPDEFGPGPTDDSVLRFIKTHRACAVWEGKDPGPLKCRGRNDEFRKRRRIVVDDRIVDIVKRVGLEGLYRTPSREIDHNLITAFVERWRPETHTFHLPHGETTITLQDVEVLFGIPIDGEAIVGTTDLTWKDECQSLLGIATNDTTLKGQRIQIKKLLEKIDEGLPDDATEVVVHQYARCYILALLADTIFADKSGDRVHTMWLRMLRNLRNPPQYSWGSACLAWLYRELCRATDRGASQIGGALLLVQYWAWVRFPFLCPRMDLPPDGAYGPPFAPSPLSIKTVWVVNTLNSPAEICLVRYRQLLDCMHPKQVVWQPYETELAHLPAFCVAGRDVWTARVPLVCFWLVEKHTPDRVVRQFGMVQEPPPYVDTDEALHAIDLRGKMNVNWRDRHYGHIRVWNTRARSLCPGARLEGDMSPAHPYFDWYDRVTWRFVDHTSASLIIMVASHKKLLRLHTVGSPEYNHISAVLKTVERLHRITARLPLENIDGANPEAPEDTGRPSTSSTRASHSHGQRAASHQVVSRADLPPPPRASPAPEFPPPPHASPSPEIPPHTAHVVSNLDISLPTTHASFHPEIPSHTSHTFFDPAHLSFTPPSFDLGPDFNQTPPVMHTQSPSYNIRHIDHVPPHSHSMSFMPTPRLHIDPMSTGTHISFATPSSPAVVGSQAKQPAVHVENEQVVGLQSPPQGRPKRTMKAPPCGTGGHKAGHNAGPTVILSSPVLNEGELESLLNDPSLKPQVLPTFFDIRKGVDGSLEKTLNIYSEAADEAVRNGSQLLVLSDRSK